MELLLVVGALTAAVWGIAALLYGSVYLSTALFFVSACVFPGEFAALDIGGKTVTLERVWLLAIVGHVAVNWYQGKLKFTRPCAVDVTIAMFFAWLCARTITQPIGNELPGQPDTLAHLLNGYAIPFVIYAALRSSKLDPKQLRPALAVLAILGIYLGVTAFLEIAKVWALVWPRFIGDHTLGIHFGRARGPMLQSVRLGVVLIACWLPMLMYTVWLKPNCRFRWFAIAMATPIMFGAIFFTYTRSIWMGLASTVMLLIIFCLRGTPKRFALVSLLTGGILVGAVKGPDLVAFKREYSAAETRESTYMRAAFAYVSIEMFKDKPITGFGFNQFQVYNLPYLSDRSTNIRLESIRGYVHHNSYLSLLTDLGIVGVGLFAMVAIASIMQILNLWTSNEAPKWTRALAMIALCLGAVHCIQMAFHEVSFSPIENGLLFGVIGLVVAAREQFAPAAAIADIGRPDRDTSGRDSSEAGSSSAREEQSESQG